MNFTRRISKIIEMSAIYCWKCKRALEAREIRYVKMRERKIGYKCRCGNVGFRTFDSIKEEILKKKPDYEFFGREKSIFGDRSEIEPEDFELPFMILYGNAAWNAHFCSACDALIRNGRTIYDVDGKKYCQQCYSRIFTTCSECRQAKDVHTVQLVEGHGQVCQKCYASLDASRCQTCGQHVVRSKMQTPEMCNRCHDELKNIRRSSVAPGVNIIVNERNTKILNDKDSEI